jgi:DNA-binding NarL/FixJ family response regulator
MLEEEGFSPCGVGQARLFEELRQALPFDLLVLGVPALDRVPELAPRDPGAPVLLLTPLHDSSLVTHLQMLHPAAQLVDRSLRSPDAIRQVLARSVDSASPVAHPPEAVRRAFAPFGLSERQLQVLELALLGHSSREIGRLLYVSELTVRNHLHSIYGAVGVSGRRELLGRFVRSLLGKEP